METSKQLDQVIEWVEEQLRFGTVPRFNDVVLYAHNELGFKKLKRNVIVERLRLMPVYLMNSRQKRQDKRGERDRPILTNDLGYLHCDIGFFSIKSGFPTVKYNSGYLIAVDILSRMIYVHILKFSRKAPSLLKGFEVIVKQFKEHTGSSVKSISFDKERSVLSHLVQNYFKANFIKFVAFQFSSSKAKRAEGSIGLIRERIARLRVLPQYHNLPWWKMLGPAADSLNNQLITVDKKRFAFTPQEINSSNKDEFKNLLYKSVPAYFFAQFNLAPQFVTFKYSLGTVVRPKLIVTSSALLGEKRREVTVESESFEIVEKIPYVTHRMSVGRAYRCVSLDHPRNIEIFSESEIVPSQEEIPK